MQDISREITNLNRRFSEAQAKLWSGYLRKRKIRINGHFENHEINVVKTFAPIFSGNCSKLGKSGMGSFNIKFNVM